MSTKVWSVTELTRAIRDLLEGELDRVWVQGEISSYKVHPSSGHAYFCLKDGRAVLTCVAWASTLRALARVLRPRDGMRVRAFGRITVYEQRGVYQLLVEQMFDEGEGALTAAFEQLKRKLEAEGLFDPARKRPLPRFPRRIGIVTSPAGAALRDMLRILSRRWPLAEVLLRPAAVQGPGAAADLAAGIADLNAARDIDVIVIGRGGGSLEDLWAFNEEVLARAIHRSSIPVISAVGHEVDFTISDFTADARAATPTHAMELAAPDAEEVIRRLSRDARFLRTTLEHCLGASRLRLRRLRTSRGLRRPHDMLHDGRFTLDRLADRLRGGLARRAEREDAAFRRLERRFAGIDLRARIASLRRRLEVDAADLGRAWETRCTRLRGRLDLAGARISALGPEQVLARGYSIVTRAATGRILLDATEVDPGEALKVRLRSGGLRCRVEERFPGENPGAEGQAGEAGPGKDPGVPGETGTGAETAVDAAGLGAQESGAHGEGEPRA